ncbi:hypothetical protein X777_14860 [Ooceraea biroi]|uniref:Uncharacterized protein n=1 Tax=Ooceraea biroi TaxID=2015173 RepID=A0A026WSQ3_OOCBI|nr:hypothetical protein X777_14860 [Ooceraea biroi]
MVLRCYIDSPGDKADPYGHLRRLRALEFWQAGTSLCLVCDGRKVKDKGPRVIRA